MNVSFTSQVMSPEDIGETTQYGLFHYDAFGELIKPALLQSLINQMYEKTPIGYDPEIIPVEQGYCRLRALRSGSATYVFVPGHAPLTHTAVEWADAISLISAQEQIIQSLERKVRIGFYQMLVLGLMALLLLLSQT